VSIRDSLDTRYLCWFSKPKAERELYHCVRKYRIANIVELGLESHQRCQRLIRLALRVSRNKDVRYSGVDLFDARPSSQPRMTLKQTHQLLSGSGATIRLIPGDALSALARCANQLKGTQLLIVAPDHDPESLAQAWMYVPRMLESNAIVLQARRHEFSLQFSQLSLATVQEWADAVVRQRRVA
jgi:hypothetical protein